MARRDGFNPELTQWLNDRGMVSADWPDNIPAKIKHAADLDVGKGHLLNVDGWPTWICLDDGPYPPRES